MSLKWIGSLLLSVMVGGAAVASDHDDGISDQKEKNLNLTDLYVFREDNQTGNSAHSKNLVLIMNSNPRAIGGQQEYFSTKGYYDFHITRVKTGDKNASPMGREDIVLRFEFGEPDANNRQAITMTALMDGEMKSVQTMDGALVTTSLADVKARNYAKNEFQLNGHTLKVFAGLREDPFFFDVEQFFKVRAGAAGLGPKEAFRNSASAVDFTVGYNVNTIVLRLPLALLQSADKEPIFDVWQTISLKQ